MELGISNRVAMVAAASKGLGRAIARALLREGCRVSICARHAETLEATRQALQNEFPGATILAIPTDVSRAEDLNNWYYQTHTQLGPVDILVTNTGGPPVGLFMELTEDQWQQGVQSTLMNVVRLSQLVIPEMRQRGWGRIVHLTSLVAREPLEMLTISSTLRAGLSALTRTQARQLAADGITVNAVLPGHIMTDRQVELNRAKAEKSGLSFEEVVRQVEQQIPARRFGKPEEIGDAVAFLCSERAAYINGVSLLVDGGIVRGTF